MLPIPVKQLLIKSIPSTITIDGSTIKVQKSFGKAPLNTINLPTVNLSIIAEGKRFYRSIDDCTIINNEEVISSDIRTAILQFTIGGKERQLTTTSTIKRTAATLYTLPKTPIVNIISVNPYIKNVDYKLLEDRETLQWLSTGPSVGSNFDVTYDYIEDGTWITSEITDYLMKDCLANLRYTLAQYNIDVINVGDVVDLSAIYTNDSLNVCAFTVQLTYPYVWTRLPVVEDGVLLEAIDLDVYVNDRKVNTIHVPEN